MSVCPTTTLDTTRETHTMLAVDTFLHTSTTLPCSLFLQECRDAHLCDLWRTAVRAALLRDPTTLALHAQFEAARTEPSMSLADHGVQPICDPARTRSIYELADGRAQSRHHIRQLLTTEPDPLIHAQTEYLLEELVTRFPRHGQRIQTCAALITACFDM